MQYKFTVIFYFGILFFLFSKTSYSQSETDCQNKFINLLNSEKSHKHNDNSYSGLIGFYKKYISSQDADSCPYSPSCSLYTYQAIEKHGIFFGLIKGFDRLSRCNRHQNDHYEHSKLHKLIDQP